MSDQQQTPPQGPAPSSMGCGGVLMILIGIVLLLPGLCTVIYGAMMIAYTPASQRMSDLIGALPFWFFGLLLAALGVGLIVAAIRRL